MYLSSSHKRAEPIGRGAKSTMRSKHPHAAVLYHACFRSLDNEKAAQTKAVGS